MKLFEYNNFSTEDFELALSNVRNTTLEQLIEILSDSLKEAYAEELSYPSNCCDFSSAFGVFIFNQLGYDVEYWGANIRLVDEIVRGHSFLKIREQVIDFTAEQFGINKSAIISKKDFDIYYDDSWFDIERTNGNKYPTFEQFKEHKNNFVVMIIYQAIDSFIKLNIAKQIN